MRSGPDVCIAVSERHRMGDGVAFYRPHMSWRYRKVRMGISGRNISGLRNAYVETIDEDAEFCGNQLELICGMVIAPTLKIYHRRCSRNIMITKCSRL